MKKFKNEKNILRFIPTLERRSTSLQTAAEYCRKSVFFLTRNKKEMAVGQAT